MYEELKDFINEQIQQSEILLLNGVYRQFEIGKGKKMAFREILEKIEEIELNKFQ